MASLRRKAQQAAGSTPRDSPSDTLHDEIIIQGRAAGLTVELLDAKGEILFD